MRRRHSGSEGASLGAHETGAKRPAHSPRPSEARAWGESPAARAATGRGRAWSRSDAPSAGRWGADRSSAARVPRSERADRWHACPRPRLRRITSARGPLDHGPRTPRVSGVCAAGLQSPGATRGQGRADRRPPPRSGRFVLASREVSDYLALRHGNTARSARTSPPEAAPRQEERRVGAEARGRECRGRQTQGARQEDDLSVLGQPAFAAALPSASIRFAPRASSCSIVRSSARRPPARSMPTSP